MPLRHACEVGTFDASALGHNDLAALLGGGAWSHEAKAPYQEAVRAYSRHRDAEALDAVKRALHPRQVAAWYRMAVLREPAQRWNETGQAYRQMLSQEPQRVEACAGLGYVLGRHGEPSEAIAPYEKALALQPGLIDAR
jgi:tetratricopeptide (TPR) repeat protein